MKISSETLETAARHLMPHLTNFSYVPDEEEWKQFPESSRTQILGFVKVVADILGRECVAATDFVEIAAPLEGMRLCIERDIDMGFAPETKTEIIAATDLAREVVKQVSRDKMLSVM